MSSEVVWHEFVMLNCLLHILYCFIWSSSHDDLFCLSGWNALLRSRETFNKWQAQRWWTENCEKVMELYNVPRLNRQAFPLPTTRRSEDDAISKIKSFEESPLTPPLGREPPPRTFFRPTGGGMACSSSDSLDHQSKHSHSNYDACCVASTPKLSSISGAKTETSSADASIRTSSSRDVERSVIHFNKASRSDTAFLANNDWRFLVIQSEGQFSTQKRESSLYNEN